MKEFRQASMIRDALKNTAKIAVPAAAGAAGLGLAHRFLSVLPEGR